MSNSNAGWLMPITKAKQHQNYPHTWFHTLGGYSRYVEKYINRKKNIPNSPVKTNCAPGELKCQEQVRFRWKKTEGWGNCCPETQNPGGRKLGVPYGVKILESFCLHSPPPHTIPHRVPPYNKVAGKQRQMQAFIHRSQLWAILALDSEKLLVSRVGKLKAEVEGICAI